MRIIQFNLGGKAYIYKKLHTVWNWIYGGCSATVLRLQLTTEMAGLAAHPELGSLAVRGPNTGRAANPAISVVGMRREAWARRQSLAGPTCRPSLWLGPQSGRVASQASPRPARLGR